MDIIYLDAADLARIIRGDLKRAFPGAVFQVRTSKYSMGSSVRVNWTDGPTRDDVDAIVGRYKAHGFDGMTDSQTNSGPVTLDDGRVVSIYSYVFTERRHSASFAARVQAWFDRRYAPFAQQWEADRALWRIADRAQVINGCLVVRRES